MPDEQNHNIGEVEKPPRTRLVLRVGVTGHRLDKLNDKKLGALKRKLTRVFQKLQTIVRSANNKADDAYDQKLPPLIRVISPLAEGADQIVAEKAIENEFELQCPLPFFRPEDPNEEEKLYGKYLEKAATVLELDGSYEKKDEAYLAAGLTVLRHCDLLIAIWDKNHARGVGGTAQIVEEARKLWVPTIWINSTEPTEPAVLLLPKKQKGWKEVKVSKLAGVLLRKLIPPVEKKKHERLSDHDHKEDLRREYFEEAMPHFNFSSFWKFFYHLLRFGRIASPRPKYKQHEWSEAINRWRKISDRTKDKLREVVKSVEKILYEHFEFADQLASRYARAYLIGFIWNFAMSGLAVMFAFLGFVVGLHDTKRALLFGLAEFLAIMSIIIVHRADKKGRWYDRRIDYRLLAELLRQTRFLAIIGRVPPLSAPPPIHTHYGDPSGSWVHWHYLGIIKQLGMPRAKLTSEYLRAVTRLIRIETNGQAKYHAKKAKRNSKINHSLHKWVVRLFGVAAVACLLHIIIHLPIDIEKSQYIAPFIKERIHYLHDYEDDISIFLSFLTIVAPAFGAALAGIRSQGEFERVARHSSAMAEYLREKSEELKKIQRDRNLTSATLARHVDDIAEKMIEEVLDWRIVFHERPIELA